MAATPSDVPLVDLDTGSKRSSETLSNACRNWGFFQVANHGISISLGVRVQQASADFFAQALETRQALSRSFDNPWGYYDRELTRNLRDRKEIFDFCPTESAPWPERPPDFRTCMETWADACHSLSLRLLQLFCEGLGLDRELLLAHFDPDHSSFTRLNHYPVKDPLAETGDVPAAGPLGISQHTDAGALTVLLQDEITGLQVFRDQQWYDVTPTPGTLTINIGDMMQVWSNDHYRAPRHRVRKSVGQDRYSIAYFLNPAYDTVMECLIENEPPLYRAFSWQEFRSLRAQGDYGDYGEEVQISRYLRSSTT